MEPARPLRDVFADLASDEDARAAHAADPQGYLAAQGHPALPGDLVGEAIVNYADTAPPEVAEHLSPFVMAHSPVPVDGLDPAAVDGMHLLATAPAEPLDPRLDHDALDDGFGADHPHGMADTPAHDPFDLDFGHGGDFGHDEQLDEMHHPVGGPTGHELGGHLGAEAHGSHVDDSMTHAGLDHADLDPTAAGGWVDDGGFGGELGHELGHDFAHEQEQGWLSSGEHHPADAPPADDLDDL
jgi:hypothetical protein